MMQTGPRPQTGPGSRVDEASIELYSQKVSEWRWVCDHYAFSVLIMEIYCGLQHHGNCCIIENISEDTERLFSWVHRSYVIIKVTEQKVDEEWVNNINDQQSHPVTVCWHWMWCQRVFVNMLLSTCHCQHIVNMSWSKCRCQCVIVSWRMSRLSWRSVTLLSSSCLTNYRWQWRTETCSRRSTWSKQLNCPAKYSCSSSSSNRWEDCHSRDTVTLDTMWYVYGRVVTFSE